MVKLLWTIYTVSDVSCVATLQQDFGCMGNEKIQATSKAQNKGVSSDRRNSREAAKFVCALAFRNARRVCLMEAV